MDKTLRYELKNMIAGVFLHALEVEDVVDKIFAEYIPVEKIEQRIKYWEDTELIVTEKDRHYQWFIEELKALLPKGESIER